MFLVQQITADPFQQQQLVLPDGSSFLLQFYFRSLQFGWFIPQLTYGSFQVKGLRITNNPNMLHQWRNLIPFGLGCFSKSEREPTQIQDFSSGASQLFVLTEAECQAYALFLSTGSLL